MVPVKGRCCVYALEYHIVWCVKYRRKVITGSVETTLLSVLNDYAKDNGFSIVEANTCPDHVHLLIQAPPTAYIPDIMKGMKGVSARVLFKEHPELKDKLWGGHMSTFLIFGFVFGFAISPVVPLAISFHLFPT